MSSQAPSRPELAALPGAGLGLLGGGAGGQIQIGVTAYPPVSVSKPPGAIDFIQSGTNAAAAGAVATLVASGLSFEVPQGQVGYIRSLTLQALNISATSGIYFGLFVGGNAATGWNNLPVFGGAMAVWSESWGPEEMTVEVQGPKTVEVRVTVTDGNTYQVSAQYHGWLVNSQVAAASDAGWGE